MTGIDEIVPFLFSFKTPKRSSKAAPQPVKEPVY